MSTSPARISVIAGQDPAGDARLGRQAEHLAHPRAGGGRHRDEDLLDAVLGHHRRQVVDGAEHREPREHELALEPLVVEEPDRLHALARVLAEVADQLRAGAPAPTRSTRRGFQPPGMVRRIRRSTASRTTSRAEPMSRTATMPSISGTVRGNPVSSGVDPEADAEQHDACPPATTVATWSRSGTVVCCHEWRSRRPQRIAADFTRIPTAR